MLRRHPRFPGTDTLFPLTTCCRSGVCAAAMAAREGISRAQLDALALESQHRADRALREGRFARSLVPVHNPDGSLALDHEEFPRPETTAEGLAAPKPSFQALADFDLGDGRPWRRQIERVSPALRWQVLYHPGPSSGVVVCPAAVPLPS